MPSLARMPSALSFRLVSIRARNILFIKQMNVSFQGKLYRDKYKNSRIIFEDVVAVFY